MIEGFRIEPLVVEVNAGDDLDGDDRGDRPIDDETERWPPACVGDELTAVLPEVFEAVASETGDEQPRRACDRSGGDDRSRHGDRSLATARRKQTRPCASGSAAG
jgi:hypothetical protein